MLGKNVNVWQGSYITVIEIQIQSCVSYRYAQGSIAIAAALSFIDISFMVPLFKMATILTYVHKMVNFIVM